MFPTNDHVQGFNCKTWKFLYQLLIAGEFPRQCTAIAPTVILENIFNNWPVQLLLKIGQNRYKQVPPKRRWTDNDDSTISLRNEQELMVARLTIFCGFSEKTVSGFGDRECDSKEKWIFCAKLHDSYGEVTWNARPSHQGEKFQKNNYYAMCELCDNRVCKQMITTSSTRCCAVRA